MKAIHKVSYYVAATLFPLMVLSCGDSSKDYDATGNFEATEVTVSAEQAGKLTQFSVNEGSTVAGGKQVGLVDTVPFYLKVRQMGATKWIYATQRPDQEKQVAALRQQLAKAEQDRKRYAQLVKDGAANRKLLDDATSEVNVLRRQVAASLSSLNNNTQSLNARMSTTDIEKLQVLDQLKKCHILSPITGTVLEKYVEQGEYVTPGKPLFKVADMNHLFLRAYVTTAQLKNVRLGQKVTVYADYGSKQRRSYQGRVSWISDRSEFTPKSILTDDERADLVYAVKIAVVNDGYIKIGMYGEVKF
ncbi:MAG: HlyD family secretion protein [Prevotella sp.]|jgi:HlyD family secretion protein